LIPNDCSVFLNIGTTTEAVAQALLHHRNLLVVTNNMNVAQILSANPDCQLLLTGGELRACDGGLVGPVAARTVADFKFDYAVIGASALDQDGDLLDFDMQEVMVSQAAIKQSRQRLLVCDQSKFHRMAPARIANISNVNHIICDGALPQAVENLCSRDGNEFSIV
jgi:DeoR family glycerol-3-phosphate regulon repressor